MKRLILSKKEFLRFLEEKEALEKRNDGCVMGLVRAFRRFADPDKRFSSSVTYVKYGTGVEVVWENTKFALGLRRSDGGRHRREYYENFNQFVDTYRNMLWRAKDETVAG